MQKTDIATHLKPLCAEIKQLHEENGAAAKRMARSIVLIGFKLQQVKQLVGHGNFEEAALKLLPEVSERARINYMALAFKMVVSARVQELENPRSGKTATVANLEKANENANPAEILALALPGNVEQATREAHEFDWLAAKLETLVREIEGKTIVEALREYGVIRKPTPDGGFRPNEQAVQDWLKEHHPELAGTKFAALPPAIQKEFKKQYRPTVPEQFTLAGKRAIMEEAFQAFAAAMDAKHYAVLTESEQDAIFQFAADLVKLGKEVKEKRKTKK